MLGRFKFLFLSPFLFSGCNLSDYGNSTRISHPDGYSLEVQNEWYGCVTEQGFTIDTDYELDEKICFGPEPRYKLGEPDLARTPQRGFDVRRSATQPRFPDESSCQAYYKLDNLRLGDREAIWAICSDGGGSGGLEYWTVGYIEIDGVFYVSSEAQQDEWGPSPFKRAYKTLLTIRKSPS